MPDIDINNIVSELNERIAVRRLAGDYPEGLERQLEAEFAGMLRAIDRHEIDTSQLDTLVQAVRRTANEVRSAGGTDSRVPGGSAAHGAMGRVVQRHVHPLAESLRDLGVAVGDALGESRRLFEAQSTADERQLHDAIAGVLDRLAVIDHLVEIVRDLEERVRVLENDAPGP
jgi:hypothetical protein